MTTFLMIAGGLVLLVLGGEVLVRGAAGLARRMGVSPLLIGLTVVGFGTSTPELVTSLQAASLGLPGIAVGNVVGSNICNILLILGIAALIYPMDVARRSFPRDGAFLLGSAVLCTAVILVGELQRWQGAALVALLLGYLTYAYLSERGSAAPAEAEAEALGPPPSLWVSLALAVGGIGLTILGARLLVDAAAALAEAAGIPEAVIGLTIVAVGTSLPELVTSVVAALRRQPDVAFGNVVGSNIYNVLGILGITAIAAPIPVPPQIAALDIWVMVAATLALIAFAVSGWRLTRPEGALLLAGYVGYMSYLGATTL